MMIHNENAGAMILSALMSSGAIYGGLLLADQAAWLHPAVAVAVVTILNLGLVYGVFRLSWAIHSEIDPRGSLYD